MRARGRHRDIHSTLTSSLARSLSHCTTCLPLTHKHKMIQCQGTEGMNGQRLTVRSSLQYLGTAPIHVSQYNSVAIRNLAALALLAVEAIRQQHPREQKHVDAKFREPPAPRYTYTYIYINQASLSSLRAGDRRKFHHQLAAVGVERARMNPMDVIVPSRERISTSALPPSLAYSPPSEACHRPFPRGPGSRRAQVSSSRSPPPSPWPGPLPSQYRPIGRIHPILSHVYTIRSTG
jgi:hypothetical protein